MNVAGNASSWEGATATLRIRDYVQIAIVAVCIALFLKTFIVGAYRIPSASMEPTLVRGDFVLVNKFIYGAKSPAQVPFTRIQLPQFQTPAFQKPQHGDLIVFDLPSYAVPGAERSGITYVKRCIALPGDTIRIINRQVRVNGIDFALPSPLEKNARSMYPAGYGDPRIFPRGSAFNEDNYGPLVIPARGSTIALDRGTFFLLRDIVEYEGNRIRIDTAGNVLINEHRANEYKVGQDYYFVLGDDRDNSLDSRFWGFVPEDKIVGKVMMVYFSLAENESDIIDRLRVERIGLLPR